MADNGELPKLLPVQVPWQVSPSTPFLRLIISEDGSTQVKLVAHFGPQEVAETPRRLGFSRALMVSTPERGDLDLSPKEAPFQLLVLTFKTGLWVRWSPSYADSQVVEEAAYDWSALACRFHAGEDPAEWLRRFREMWKSTSICPNPGIYTVVGSTWLQEMGEDGSAVYRHYLILGHDAYVEVIAEDWGWKSEGGLAGW